MEFLRKLSPAFPCQNMERPIAGWRYMADASYWMYIVHPPVVMGAADHAGGLGGSRRREVRSGTCRDSRHHGGDLPLPCACNAYWRTAERAPLPKGAAMAGSVVTIERDGEDRPLASGVYLYRLTTAGDAWTRKLTLLR